MVIDLGIETILAALAVSPPFRTLPKGTIADSTGRIWNCRCGLESPCLEICPLASILSIDEQA
jgi:hypothetical protein